MTLRFLPLSSTFLPLFNPNAQVAVWHLFLEILSPVYASWRVALPWFSLTFPFLLSLLTAVTYSPFPLSSFPCPTSHTQIAPSSWAFLLPPPASRLICYHLHRQICCLGLSSISYHNHCKVLFSASQTRSAPLQAKEAVDGQTPLLTNLTAPLAPWQPSTCYSPAVPAAPNLCPPSRLSLTAFPQSTFFRRPLGCPYHFCTPAAFFNHIPFNLVFLHLIWSSWHDLLWFIHKGSAFQALS